MCRNFTEMVRKYELSRDFEKKCQKNSENARNFRNLIPDVIFHFIFSFVSLLTGSLRRCLAPQPLISLEFPVFEQLLTDVTMLFKAWDEVTGEREEVPNLRSDRRANLSGPALDSMTPPNARVGSFFKMFEIYTI